MDSVLVTVLTNAGVAGVVVILILMGWLVPKPYYDKLEAENRSLREQARLDRQRGDDAEQAGRVTNQLIGALQDLAAERHRRKHGDAPGSGLTWEDLR